MGSLPLTEHTILCPRLSDLLWIMLVSYSHGPLTPSLYSGYWSSIPSPAKNLLITLFRRQTTTLNLSSYSASNTLLFTLLNFCSLDVSFPIKIPQVENFYLICSWLYPQSQEQRQQREETQGVIVEWIQWETICCWNVLSTPYLLTPLWISVCPQLSTSELSNIELNHFKILGYL